MQPSSFRVSAFYPPVSLRPISQTLCVKTDFFHRQGKNKTKQSSTKTYRKLKYILFLIFDLLFHRVTEFQNINNKSLLAQLCCFTDENKETHSLQEPKTFFHKGREFFASFFSLFSHFLLIQHFIGKILNIICHNTLILFFLNNVLDY